MVLNIEGMSCEHCAKKVHDALSDVAGVSSVNVKVKKGIAKVKGNDLDEEALKQAVKDSGYEVK